MRQTLETFFERTAYSRDASEFLILYHGVDRDRFLLLIPALCGQSELSDLLKELEYLIDLELYPTIYLSRQFIVEDLYGALVRELRKFDLKLEEESEKGFLKDLIQLGKTQEYFKYLWTGGALRDVNGKVINRVQLMRDRNSWSFEALDQLTWIREFLNQMGRATSIQAVASHQILPELFTSHGAGTLISLGYEFSWLGVDSIDEKRLCSLLENGFGKKLKPCYLDSLGKESRFFVESEYRGAIVLESWGAGLYYLDKVVVESSYFGRGLGSLLLDELTLQMEGFSGDVSKLCWRARLDNPYLNRYAAMVYRRSHDERLNCGTLGDGEYVYHFIGVDSKERGEVVQRMQRRPSSFVSEDL